MGFSFSNSSIEDLKNQVNIVDVVGRVVTLKRAGTNFKGVCPFHNEKTPSFVVSEQKQIFTCFGCGAKGDVIEFVEKHYNLDFGEAVEKIAGEYGITLEKRSYDDNRDAYYEVNRQAAAFFYRAFTEQANKGYSYMKNRGIDDAVLKKFGIGYADEQWDSLYKYLTEKGVTKEMLLELGLVSESKGKCYDKFRNRVIFPIINTSGKVIGFGGRAIGDDNPKYLNSAESRIFQKKNNLYGLNITRQEIGKSDNAILVEGYMDTISLYQGGVRNVVASLGTALTENQAKLLKRYTGEVVLSYDADSAGRAAALRGLDVLSKESCKVKVLHVTDGKDPDEFIKKKGKTEFLKLVDEALPYTDYKLSVAKAKYDISNDEGRIDFIREATGIIKELGPVEQDVYIQKLSKELKISDSAIKMELLGKDSSEKRKFVPRDDSSGGDPDIASNLEKNLFKILFINSDYMDKIIHMEGIFSTDFGSKVYQVIKNDYQDEGRIDFGKVMDSLEPRETAYLQSILEDVIIAGNEEQVFRECVDTYNQNILAKEEKELIMMLSLADEDNNTDKINELTKKLMEVQRKRNCSSRGNNNE